MQNLGGQGPPKTFIFQGFRTLQNLHFSRMSHAKCKFWVFAKLHQRKSKISSFERCLKRNASFGAVLASSGPSKTFIFDTSLNQNARFWMAQAHLKPSLLKDVSCEIQVLDSPQPSKTFIFKGCLTRYARFDRFGALRNLHFWGMPQAICKFWKVQKNTTLSFLKDVSYEIQVLAGSGPSKTFIFEGCLERYASFGHPKLAKSSLGPTTAPAN